MLKTLVERHPSLFRGRIPPQSKLPDGWYPLVDILCTELETSLSPEEMETFHIRQITSEQGALRIASGGIRQVRVQNLVEAVERLSAWVCSECGSPRRFRTGSDRSTLCEFCEHEMLIRAAHQAQGNTRK